MADIRITRNELNDPAIDEVIGLERQFRQATGEAVEDIPTPFYYNPLFYYSLAGLAGGLIAWGTHEPFYSDRESMTPLPFINDFLLFGPVAAFIGLFIGVSYGLSNRNVKQALYCGVVGLGVGLGATVVTTFAANWLYNITATMAVTMSGARHDGIYQPRGVAFFVQTCGRGIAWAIVATGGGVGLGISLKSPHRILNGLAGALVGGLLGGLLFDPIDRFIYGWGEEAATSRGIGIAAIGLLVGFFVGLFENISKEAWFQMLRGPLAGKQFILFKSPMVVGSAPKCDIYIFKDPVIEPCHASITKTGTKYLLRDEGTEAGTFVNGRRIDRYILQPDDFVTIGEAVLKYHERHQS